MLAQVVGLSETDLKAKLSEAGYPVKAGQNSLQEVIGSNLRAQIETIGRLAPATSATP